LVSEYEGFLKSHKKKNQLNTDLQLRATKEQDYNAFLLEELLTANFVAGQQEELSQYDNLIMSISSKRI
jgi:DNA repair protein RecN (Recombination protein N)